MKEPRKPRRVERYEQALQMRDNGKTYREIGTELGVTPQAAYKMLARRRARFEVAIHEARVEAVEKSISTVDLITIFENKVKEYTDCPAYDNADRRANDKVLIQLGQLLGKLRGELVERRDVKADITAPGMSTDIDESKVEAILARLRTQGQGDCERCPYRPK